MLSRVVLRLRTNQLARGASVTLLARVYGASLAYATQMYLAAKLGAEEFGVFAFAWTWLSVIAFLAPLGFDTSLVRFVPTFQEQNAPAKVRAVLRLGQRTTLAASMLASALGLALILLLARDSSYSGALLVAAFAIPALAMVHLYEGIARGFHWISQVSIPTYAIRPTLLFAGSWFAIEILARRSGQATVAAAGIACLLTVLYQIVAYSRRLPDAVRNAPIEASDPSWLGMSRPMVLVASFELMIANTDILMMGFVRGPAETGVYNVAARTAGSLLLIFFAISAFAAPKIASLHARGATSELHRFCRRVQLWMLGPTLLGLLALALAGPWLLTMFGEEFEAAYVPMVILAVGVTARAACGPIDNLLTMTGQQRAIAIALGGTALLNLLGNALLIPRYGAHGAVSATAGCVLVELCIISALVRRHTGFSPCRPPATTDLLAANDLEKSP